MPRGEKKEITILGIETSFSSALVKGGITNFQVRGNSTINRENKTKAPREERSSRRGAVVPELCSKLSEKKGEKKR